MLFLEKYFVSIAQLNIYLNKIVVSLTRIECHLNDLINIIDGDKFVTKRC